MFTTEDLVNILKDLWQYILITQKNYWLDESEVIKIG
jgi:hypothetical protein